MSTEHIRIAAAHFITSLVSQGEIANTRVFGILAEQAATLGYSIKYTAPSVSQLELDIRYMKFKYEGMLVISREDG